MEIGLEHDELEKVRAVTIQDLSFPLLCCFAALRPEDFLVGFGSAGAAAAFFVADFGAFTT